jgi:homoserine O-succinyltransferase
MPIIIPRDRPAFNRLRAENIFVMKEARAVSQDIRPIEIAIVNLMPTKEETETQLMRLLGNSPLQINVTLINTATYESKNTPQKHLQKFYRSIEDAKHMFFDGLIVTGAPVETMPFEEVLYWEELKSIMDFAEKRVTSTIFICWGAQAGLYHHYGIDKKELPRKLFGVFPTYSVGVRDPLLRGMDDIFYIPHSRHTCVPEESILNCKDLTVLAKSDEAGISIVKSRDDKKIFLFGHSEYDSLTLENEYKRDLAKGLDIAAPLNYYSDASETTVDVKWRSTANLFFYNWLNYYVYQVTPYRFEEN